MTEVSRFSRAPKKVADIPTITVEQTSPTDEIVKLTYRVTRVRWEALGMRKMRERRSIQQIIDDALSAYLGD